MERKAPEPTFTDSHMSDLGGPRASAFFKVCQSQIPWAKLAEPLTALFQKEPGVGPGGRPHWPLEMMIKIMLMQKWFNLSDPMMEEMLKDRISFRRFVGLGWDDATPDETTICVFRGRLLSSGLGVGLFDQSLAILSEHGLVLKEGTLVDATIIETPRGQKREDGTNTKNPTATWTCKRGDKYFGFKASISTDKRGMIKDWVYDTAKVSDHRHADTLMENEPAGGEVYADSGYRSRARSEGLEARGVKAMIATHRVPGQKELTSEQKTHNRAVAGVRGLVELPFAWIKNMMGGGKTRYRGLRRNALDFVLMAVAYNWQRSFSIACILY
jgi:IS5 family transposase